MPKTAVSLFLCLLASLAQGRPEPSFNPRDVVRQVRSGTPAVSREPSADNSEFLIDTSTTRVPVSGNQANPAVAFDGANFLLVWQDFRSGYDWDIYGARVTPQGTVLDSAGFVVARTAADQLYPAVAFDGTDFLVVWTDWRNGNGIYGARVTPQGTLLDSAGFVISIANRNRECPAVAFDGTNHLVVWEDSRMNAYKIYGARVTPQCSVLDPSGFLISPAANDKNSPTVAYDGENYLVVWEDYRSGTNYDIYGARVTPQGLLLDSSGIVISQAPYDQEHPGLAFDGTNFLVAWDDGRSIYPDIYGARVTPQGLVLDTSDFAISQGGECQLSPAIAFDGVNLLVTWQDGDGRSGSDYDICGARVTPEGQVLDHLVISEAGGDQVASSVGFDGANYVVTWGDGRNLDGDIYGARVTPQGLVLDPSGFAVSQAAYDQGRPALGFDGANFLVVWQDQRNGSSYDIYGARVTPQGLVLDPSGSVVSQAANNQLYPAVAFDGANYLAVWTDWRSGNYYPDIYGARVTPQGTLLDPAGFAISQAGNFQKYPALAFDGADFLVAWVDQRNNTSVDIYGARVTPQGSVLDPTGIVISKVADDHNPPALAFDGTNFLVVWENYPAYDLFGTRVTPGGLVLDSSGFAISQAANGQRAPALAFDGTSFLAVWGDGRNGGSDIYGARVTPQGLVLDPSGFVISRAANSQLQPALAFDGADFLVVWQDGRSGLDYDLYGARVTPAGVVFDSGSVVRQESNQGVPALALGAGSHSLLVYEGWTGSANGKTYNTDRIWGKMNPLPGVAETPKVEVRTPNFGPSIVRGVLRLPPASSLRLQASSLLDATGRKVAELKPGPNDIRHLAPGIYFVHSAFDVRHSTLSAKVVVTR